MADNPALELLLTELVVALDPRFNGGLSDSKMLARIRSILGVGTSRGRKSKPFDALVAFVDLVTDSGQVVIQWSTSVNPYGLSEREIVIARNAVDGCPLDPFEALDVIRKYYDFKDNTLKNDTENARKWLSNHKLWLKGGGAKSEAINSRTTGIQKLLAGGSKERILAALEKLPTERALEKKLREKVVQQSEDPKAG